ncbi:MAG TPA: hypothetical protein VFA26_15920, partial [Gemmataceae bacterium]|nr:hypothetical protein [Gemmataceae bacterium]
GELDRRRCREVFEERFTADRMARDYLAVYRRVLEEWQGDGRSRAKRPRPWLAPEPPPLIRSGGPAPRVPAAGPMLQPPLG